MHLGLTLFHSISTQGFWTRINNPISQREMLRSTGALRDELRWGVLTPPQTRPR